MNDLRDKTSTRRAFFLTGGAALGAGVAATAAGAAAHGSPEASGNVAEDREAIRALHAAFLHAVETGRFGTAAELFTGDARLALGAAMADGQREIERFFDEQYRCQQADCFHTAYRQGARQQRDAIHVAGSRLQARATFHVEVEISAPLRDDSTIAAMARLQGHVADRRWESGRFEGRYVREQGQWRMVSLDYVTA